MGKEWKANIAEYYQKKELAVTPLSHDRVHGLQLSL